MQKSADKAAAAVPVVVTTARPVAIVGKMLEHEVEHLHRLCDLRFRHWFERSRCGNERTVARAAAIAAPCSRQNNRFPRSERLAARLVNFPP
jgi:hypothetical protein